MSKPQLNHSLSVILAEGLCIKERLLNMKKNQEALTYRNALLHERKDAGQVKFYTQTNATEKDYNRRRGKRELRRQLEEEY